MVNKNNTNKNNESLIYNTEKIFVYICYNDI